VRMFGVLRVHGVAYPCARERGRVEEALARAVLVSYKGRTTRWSQHFRISRCLPSIVLIKTSRPLLPQLPRD